MSIQLPQLNTDKSAVVQPVNTNEPSPALPYAMGFASLLLLLGLVWGIAVSIRISQISRRGGGFR